jgi:hypothetical protein
MPDEAATERGRRLGRDMSDQGIGDDGSLDDPLGDAFEEDFQPEKFARVAQALDVPEDLETLVWLRDLLLPSIRLLGEGRPAPKLSHKKRIGRLKKLREAAVTLEALLGPGGSKSGLPWRMWGSKLLTDQFTGTLRVLALEADKQIQRRGQGGAPPKDEARQLGEDLIGVYEKLMRKRAEDLDFGRFNRFAAAVFSCMRSCAPTIGRKIPPTPRTLRDMLREVWELEVDPKDEKTLPVETNNSAR